MTAKYSQAYYLKNREKILARTSAWAKANRAKVNARRNRPESTHRAISKRWREENKERSAMLIRSAYIKWKYGMTWAEYESMLAQRKGKCDACSQPPTGKGSRSILHVDHCHATGKVRGFLCPNCNSAIGYANDDIATLRKLIAYLEANA